MFKARAVYLALEQEHLPSHQVGTSSPAASQDWSPRSADEEEGTAASILHVSKCLAQEWYRGGEGPHLPRLLLYFSLLKRCISHNHKKAKTKCFKCSLKHQVGVVHVLPHVMPTRGVPPAVLVVPVRNNLCFCSLSPSSLTWCTERRPC